MSSDVLAFVVAFSLTIVSLLGVMGSGFARRRRLHYALVVATLALLLVAILFAERMGRGLVFEGAAGQVKRVHMVFVAATTAQLVGMVITGVRLARAPAEAERRRRARHRVMAFWFLALVVVTSGLGLTMTWLAMRAAGG